MSDVPPRNIQKNIQYRFIRNRLEKLMPWISGSYIPIKKLSEDPPTTPPRSTDLDFGDWLDFWVFIINSSIYY